MSSLVVLIKDTMRTLLSILYILFFGAVLGVAQAPITGTCSINFPPGMTFDGTTFAVPVISTTTLQLTRGVTYADGLYLTSLKGGAVTYTPYVPPSGTPATPTSPVTPVTPAAGKAYTVAIPEQKGWSLNWYIVPNAVVTSGQTFSISPVVIGVPTPVWNYINETLFVNSLGAVYIRVGNGTATALPASQAVVTIK